MPGRLRSQSPELAVAGAAIALMPKIQAVLLPPCNGGLRAVVLLQVFRDHLGVGFVDWGAKYLDHLADLRIPARSVQEWRVHRDIGKRVAGLAIGLHPIDAWR